MADRVGQQLGNYRLTRLLGKGGFAEVYLGEHVYLETQAAIKVLLTQLASQDMEPFRLEAKRAAHLEHPHIVRVLEFGVDGSTPYLVMSYAPNGTLRQRHLKGIALPIATILGYVKQAAEALQYAHDEHFIHRDVKPENLLVGRRQEVLLSDFGIALLTQTSRSQSMRDVAGTASYMAPEQFQGKPRPASDQYALGVVVYEWLTGDRPFHGSFTEIASQHLFVPPPPLHEKMLAISPAVEQVVMIALAKDPKQRFGNIQAFATALEQASQSAAIDDTAQVSWNLQSSNERTALSQPQQPAEFVSQPAEAFNPTELITPESRSSSRTGPSMPANQSSLPAEAIPPFQQSSFPLPELEGPTLLPQSPPAVQSQEILPMQTTEVSPRPVVPPVSLPQRSIGPVSLSAHWTLICTYREHAKAVRSVAWSPDGKTLASGSDDKTVQVWDAATGSPLLTYRGHSSGLKAIAWSPSGNLIASGGARTVQVWHAFTGKEVVTYQAYSSKLRSVGAVTWSPDGTRIVSAGDDIQIFEAALGKKLLTYPRFGALMSVTWSPDGRCIAAAGVSKSVRVWEATSGAELLSYGGHTGWVYAVAWSPDGKRIASGSGDKTVQVWDAMTAKTLSTYHDHTEELSSVSWSPDGHYIASSGLDRTVRVWEVSTGKTLFSYRHELSWAVDSVEAVAWSPDGWHIASGGGDKTVQVWQAL